MKSRVLTLIVALVMAATLTPVPAAAQSLNQMIQNQVRMQQWGNQQAMAAANAYYQYALRLRRMGYTGPIPTGVTSQSLQAANQALMQAGTNYVQSTQNSFNRMHDQVTSTSNAITHGCSNGYTWNGFQWICQ
jgi:hypothetical protein